MKIALLVPSRERIDLKKRLIKSIVNTASSTDNLTLYFGIDDDDPEKKLALVLTKEYDFVKVVEIHNEGKFIGLSKIWNECSKQSNEEIVALIGDDMEFKSKNWDIEILKEFEAENLPKDKIKMVYCNDLYYRGKLAVNHFLHRKYIDINGYYTRDEFKSWGVDTWIHQVFKAMGRAKYRNDIIIEHKQHKLGKASKEPDSVTKNLSKNGANMGHWKIWKRTKSERLKEVRRFYYYLGVEYNPREITG